jgi:hypothetical protein
VNIYILQDGQQAGPYTRGELQQFLAAGQVQGTDLAWREGLGEWVPLASIVPVLAGKPAPAAVERPAPGAPTQPIRAGEPKPEPRASRPWPWLKIIGALAVAAVLFLGAVVAVIFWQGSKLDVSSKSYIDDYVSTVAPNWSSDDFVNRVAPQFREQFNHDALAGLFSRLSILGKLKQYDGSKGHAHISLKSLGKTVTAKYEAHATFDGGDATFEIVLLRVSGQWTIAGFSVNSPVFHQ